MARNPIMLIDGYKLDHRRQYPPGIRRVLSNITARSSRIPDQDFVVALGIQYYTQRYLIEEMGRFFTTSRAEVLARYQRRVDGYLGPNDIGTDHIAALHDLGYVPLEIRALPEGTRVPLGVPMVTVENTHDDFAWLVNYYETLMSAALWLPTTSATTAYRSRKNLEEFARLTGSPVDFVGWQGHDFSFRGMAGLEAAEISGIGHLLFFEGTDTIPAIDLIEDYYGRGLPDDYLIGGSVAATEHSVVCAGGYGEEKDTLNRLLDLYPAGILSYVSDTWDLWGLLTETLPALKDRILGRDGKLVIRPDSGDPVLIVCGNPDAPEGSPARKGVAQLLWEEFGGSTTPEGFKVLDPHIGIIYGDGINEDRERAILHGLYRNGFASGNVVFGMGSYRYQFTTRDTYGIAMKATWVDLNGTGHNLFKDPITDDGGKRSAKDRLAVVPGGPLGLELVQEADADAEARSLLRPVFRDGEVLNYENFATIRERARSGF